MLVPGAVTHRAAEPGGCCRGSLTLGGGPEVVRAGVQEGVWDIPVGKGLSEAGRSRTSQPDRMEHLEAALTRRSGRVLLRR